MIRIVMLTNAKYKGFENHSIYRNKWLVEKKMVFEGDDTAGVRTMIDDKSLNIEYTVRKRVKT